MKTTSKAMNKKYKIALIVSVILVFLFSFVTGYFISVSYLSDNNSFGEVMSSVDEIIEYNWNLSETQQIFNNCSTKENESEQILCVNKWAASNYNYAPRDEAYSIDEMFEKGADCVSYSIYYATLAKMMGYEYVFVIIPNHVITIVYFDNGYCVLDGKIGTCIYYEEDLNL